jgi:hypothetical protein
MDNPRRGRVVEQHFLNLDLGLSLVGAGAAFDLALEQLLEQPDLDVGVLGLGRQRVEELARAPRYFPLDGRGGRGATEPPRFSKLKIVCGSLGTDPGGSTLVGLAGGGGGGCDAGAESTEPIQLPQVQGDRSKIGQQGLRGAQELSPRREQARFKVPEISVDPRQLLGGKPWLRRALVSRRLPTARGLRAACLSLSHSG